MSTVYVDVTRSDWVSQECGDILAKHFEMFTLGMQRYNFSEPIRYQTFWGTAYTDSIRYQHSLFFKINV